MSQVNANVNQMCESLGYGRAAVAVSLFSVGNGLGRILAGTLSELVHRSQCAPRTFSLLASATLMTAAHFLFWLELGEGALYTAVFLSALAFGATMKGFGNSGAASRASAVGSCSFKKSRSKPSPWPRQTARCRCFFERSNLQLKCGIAASHVNL